MVVREINSLKQTLNDPDINTTQSLTFVKDFESQILYITEPKSREIWRYELQNSLCQVCQQNADVNVTDMSVKQSGKMNPILAGQMGMGGAMPDPRGSDPTE